MQTRRMIVALFASLAVFYLWLLISPFIFPAPPQSETARPSEADSTTAQSHPAPASLPAGAQASQPGPAELQAAGPGATAADGVVITGGERISPVWLGTTGHDGPNPPAEDSPYPMAVEILPQGAVISRASIRGHYDSVDAEIPYPIMAPLELPGGLSARSFPTTNIHFEKQKLDVALDKCVWKVADIGDEHVEFSVDVAYKGLPLARIHKRYELHPQPPKDHTCDLGLSLRIENLSAEPVRVTVTQGGPIGFKKEELRGEDRRIIRAVWEDGDLESKGYERKKVFKAEGGKVLLGEDNDEGNRIAWIAEGNKYFACVMAPAGRMGPKAEPRFARVEAFHLTDLEDEGDRERQDLTFRYITDPLVIAPGEGADVAFDCYIGPKSKVAFEQVEAYRKREYYAVISESFLCCAPGSLVGMMMWLLNAFHAIPPHNYGIAIIVLVLVVRAALHPITKKSQVSMLRMQKQTAKLQPKIQAAKEKYANDRGKMNQAVMEIYREEGINPASNFISCLPMLLQIPIWGALWTALANTIEMRHAPFDGWWIKDLTRPDALITFGRSVRIPLISFIMNGPLESLNLLPILLGITQILQARFMPRGSTSAQPSGNPDQLEQQRKMMMFMSIFFIFVLYNAPSGLTLYIMASNLFGILEQWRIRQHLAQAEARGDLENDKRKVKSKSGEPRPKSWIQRQFEGLQKRAEEAKRVESPRKKSKPHR